MRRFLTCFLVPILCIVVAFAVIAVVLSVWPAAGNVASVGVALVLCAALFLVGTWIYRTATSTLHLLGGLVGPAACFGYWVFVFRSIAANLPLLVDAVDYLYGITPLAAIILGYAYSARKRSARSSV